ASFRRPLAGSPLRFASTSPPSGCAGDFHPQAVEHARHTGITALQAGVHSLPSPSRPTLTAPRKFSLISGTVLFLSHAPDDDAFVGELRRALEDLQHPVWVDSRNLRGGSKLAPEIAAAIERADHFLVVLSPSTVNSPWVRREIKKALKVEKRRKADG